MKQIKQRFAMLLTVGPLMGLLPVSTPAQVDGNTVYFFDLLTIPDCSTNNINGRLENGATLGADVPFPAAYAGNQSVSLNGTGVTNAMESHVLISRTPLPFDLSTNDFSVHMWVKPNESRGMTLFTSSTIPDVFLQRIELSLAASNEVGQAVLRLDDTFGGLLPAFLFSGSSDDVPVGAWTHVAAVLDRSGANGPTNSVYLYINGAEAASQDVTGLGDVHDETQATRYFMAIGTSFQVQSNNEVTTVDAANAQIDEFRLIERALSPAEILAASLNSLSPGLKELEGFSVVDAGIDDTGLRFASDTNSNYVLQFANHPNPNSFLGTGFTVQGTGADITVLDPDGFSTSKVYRILKLQ
jgi:hypothetical protein